MNFYLFERGRHGCGMKFINLHMFWVATRKFVPWLNRFQLFSSISPFLVCHFSGMCITMNASASDLWPFVYFILFIFRLDFYVDFVFVGTSTELCARYIMGVCVHTLQQQIRERKKEETEKTSRLIKRRRVAASPSLIRIAHVMMVRIYDMISFLSLSFFVLCFTTRPASFGRELGRNDSM